MDCGLMWLVGVSILLQRSLRVPLHSPKGRQIACPYCCARRLWKSAVVSGQCVYFPAPQRCPLLLTCWSCDNKHSQSAMLTVLTPGFQGLCCNIQDNWHFKLLIYRYCSYEANYQIRQQRLYFMSEVFKIKPSPSVWNQQLEVRTLPLYTILYQSEVKFFKILIMTCNCSS